jgi:hypothetical protein
MPTPAPYTCGGLVYNSDGSTLIEGATVTLRDFTQSAQLTTTTNASGEWLLDLANLSGATYEDGDVCYIMVNYPNRYEHCRFTVDTDVGVESKNLTLRVGRDPMGLSPIGFGSAWLYAGTIDNPSGSALYVDLYEAGTDTRLARFNVPTVTAHSFHYGKIGLEFQGGILVLTAGTGGISTETSMVTLVFS